MLLGITLLLCCQQLISNSLTHAACCHALRSMRLALLSPHLCDLQAVYPCHPALHGANGMSKGSCAGCLQNVCVLQDCVHFDFGDGTCPFGSSCFYRHAYRNGRLEVSVLYTVGCILLSRSHSCFMLLRGPQYGRAGHSLVSILGLFLPGVTSAKQPALGQSWSCH